MALEGKEEGEGRGGKKEEVCTDIFFVFILRLLMGWRCLFFFFVLCAVVYSLLGAGGFFSSFLFLFFFLRIGEKY